MHFKDIISTNISSNFDLIIETTGILMVKVDKVIINNFLILL